MEKISSKDEKLVRLERLFPDLADWSMLTLTCDREHYSASLIARAVEDCDAHLLNLNVTSNDGYGDTGRVVVEIRISHANAMSVARSLERYGFTVLEMDSSSNTSDIDVLSERVDELLRYLQV